MIFEDWLKYINIFDPLVQIINDKNFNLFVRNDIRYKDHHIIGLRDMPVLFKFDTNSIFVLSLISKDGNISLSLDRLSNIINEDVFFNYKDDIDELNHVYFNIDIDNLKKTLKSNYFTCSLLSDLELINRKLKDIFKVDNVEADTEGKQYEIKRPYIINFLDITHYNLQYEILYVIFSRDINYKEIIQDRTYIFEDKTVDLRIKTFNFESMVFDNIQDKDNKAILEENSYNFNEDSEIYSFFDKIIDGDCDDNILFEIPIIQDNNKGAQTSFNKRSIDSSLIDDDDEFFNEYYNNKNKRFKLNPEYLCYVCNDINFSSDNNTDIMNTPGENEESNIDLSIINWDELPDLSI